MTRSNSRIDLICSNGGIACRCYDLVSNVKQKQYWAAKQNRKIMVVRNLKYQDTSKWKKRRSSLLVKFLCLWRMRQPHLYMLDKQTTSWISLNLRCSMYIFMKRHTLWICSIRNIIKTLLWRCWLQVQKVLHTTNVPRAEVVIFACRTLWPPSYVEITSLDEFRDPFCNGYRWEIMLG